MCPTRTRAASGRFRSAQFPAIIWPFRNNCGFRLRKLTVHAISCRLDLRLIGNGSLTGISRNFPATICQNLATELSTSTKRRWRILRVWTRRDFEAQLTLAALPTTTVAGVQAGAPAVALLLMPCPARAVERTPIDWPRWPPAFHPAGPQKVTVLLKSVFSLVTSPRRFAFDVVSE